MTRAMIDVAFFAQTIFYTILSFANPKLYRLPFSLCEIVGFLVIPGPRISSSDCTIQFA